MKTYILKRILIMIPVFLGISIIIFTLIHLAPGDPYAYMAEANLPRAERELQLQKIGYYDPLPVQYVKWFANVLKGNLGYSIKYSEPVVSVISRRIGNTALLSVTALVLSTLLSIPLGILCAVCHRRFPDYLIFTVTAVGISVPAFFLALGLVKIFAIDLKIFPISGIVTTGSNKTGTAQALDILSHMALPLTVLVFSQAARMVRYVRTVMLETLGQDYIRTARAKGLADVIVVCRHGFRNALITIVTLIAMSLGHLLSGAVLIETVFVWPGMGTLIYQAVSNRDYPLVIAGTMFLSVCILFANLLADILYAVIDPRIRYH